MYDVMYNIYKSQLNVENVGAVVAAPDKVRCHCLSNAVKMQRVASFLFTLRSKLVAKKLFFLYLVAINVRSI